MSLVDTTRRDAYARLLASQLADDRWSVDELRVVQLVVDGLARGRSIYGALDLASDTRDWALEARAEARDLVVYRACEMLAAQDKRRAELERAASREITEENSSGADVGTIHPTDVEQSNARRSRPDQPAPSLRSKTITIPGQSPGAREPSATVTYAFDVGDLEES